MQERLDRFLHQYGMHYDSIPMRECADEYIREMEAGLAGTEGCTLMMLPTYLNTQGDVPVGEPIIVMDAGGTNLRVATVTFDESRQAAIEHFTKHPMPGTQGTLTREEFFDAIAGYLMPVVGASRKVGFCFSFPTEILPNKDGRFLKFSKEVSATGMKDAVMGEELNKALAKRGVEPKQFILLNDTVAAMLGGITADPDRQADSYIGFILGTGTNTCYVEENKNILKAPAALAMPGSMVINVESGGYGRFPRGKIDELLDSTTNNPGAYQLEKMVSGAYQGNVVYLTVKQAAADGLFTPAFGEGFSRLSTITMREIDDFCDNPRGKNTLAAIAAGSSADQELLRGILEASYERAARMSAIAFGAIMLKTKTGFDPSHPVYIAAEGTTFHKSRVFKEKINQYVSCFLQEELKLYSRFVKVENVTLLGTAIAGLLN